MATRESRLTAYVTEREYQLASNLATKAEVSISEYLRKLLVKAGAEDVNQK